MILITWSEVEQRISSEEKISPLIRERAKHAVAYLKKFFDDGSGNIADDHPLLEHLINAAPWVNEWLIWFAEALRRTEHCPGFSKLLVRLKARATFSEGLQVLSYGEKLASANLGVEFDPVTTNGKMPDIGISNAAAADQLYVEVSALGQSDTERMLWEKFDRLSNLFFHHPLRGQIIHSVRMLKWPSHSHLSDLLKTIEDAINRANRDQALVELAIADVIEAAIAPIDQRAILQLWCDKHGLNVNEITGFGVEIDRLRRLHRKILEKAKQLPDGLPNVIIVESADLMFFARDPASLVSVVEEMIFDIAHIALFVLSGRFMDFKGGESRSFGVHRYSHYHEAGSHSVRSLVFLNKYCRVKIAPETLTRISAAIAP